MYKVTAVYRWRSGATFDHDYYKSRHLQLTHALLDPLGLQSFECEQVLLRGSPQDGQAVAVSNAYFATLEQAHAALAKAGGALLADVSNYSNLQPEIHISVVTTRETNEG